MLALLGLADDPDAAPETVQMKAELVVRCSA